MVHDLFFQEFLVGILLWLGIAIYLWWPHSLAAKPPLPQPPKRTPRIPKPFAGLPQKPHCTACVQAQEHRDQPPLSPPPLSAHKRGRPRTQSIPIPSTVPRKRAPITAGSGRAISVQTAIRGVGSGDNFTVWSVTRISWKRTARPCMASPDRPSASCRRLLLWLKAWAFGLWPECLRCEHRAGVGE
jgi:hypothetical protein